ncbi:MAG TPA: toprim domain-containing protein [Candidatus Paceibacterota bacterium]|jgi:recombination protein RecR|nr:toprim domain-containing protein [Candidatus Paceibacterota bacterium]
MDSIDRLTSLFEKFPGIGPRQARRFVQYLLSTTPPNRSELSDLIKRLGVESQQCAQCYRWFTKNGTKGDLCSICANPAREAAVLFVVEKDADIENVERSGFRGLYFVLGGTIGLASEEPEKFVRLRELLVRVEEDASQLKLNELILGLSATTEGDHTREILMEKLRPLSEGLNFKISSLGRGLSTGSELEYADPDTIAQALGNRH